MFWMKKRKATAVAASYEKGYANGREEGFLAGRENARQLSLGILMKRITALDVRVQVLERLTTTKPKSHED